MRSSAFVRRAVFNAAVAPRRTAVASLATATLLQTTVAHSLHENRRSFATHVLLCSAQPKSDTTTGSSSADTGAAADAAASALDIAMRVNKLKRLHQTGGNANSGKKQLEFTAWKELNTLSEEQINHAEGKAVALLLNSWAYFAKFWEKGKDGPHGVNAPLGDGQGDSSAQN
jgi:hypothetical protein